MPDHDQLDQSIYIHLTTAHGPSKRGLAGTGRSRRRERLSAHSIATDIAKAIRINHRIERYGATVPEAEVIDLLAEELWNVPAVTTKELVGIDANKRDTAKRTITNVLLTALTSRYECTFFRPAYRGMGPSTAATN
ncbi:hypothetical protein [Sinorhizobium sp. GL28]|uniref:hypothetical protein n=1 Tax=Sinorhizobium sp. GL28 TaxID=1358418 RepID=UPI00071DEB51|nr:hypothetical protein [Sinorhizobium sp. GL28]KSV84382.1 hypothetical protein N184_33995 [Sinorhizobium sp. GL28]